MAFDYKKEYKEFYLPPKTPGIIDIPEMHYLAVRGEGNPNEPDGAYKEAIGLLYSIAFTIKMSYKGSHKIEGYFSYVVPPLEGLWWQRKQKNEEGSAVDGSVGEEISGEIDYSRKDDFRWISMIRLPEFVTREVFDWAIREATEKKKQDFSKVEYFTYREGLCVQCMHIGSYDAEPATIRKMDEYAQSQGYQTDFENGRFHHEIYLSDPRRAAQEKLRTVIRHPVRKMEV